MIRPELFKEQWTHISPRILELFPKLTDQDLQEINGNFETLVAKVNEKHGMPREEVLAVVQPLVMTPVETQGAKKTGR